MQERDQKQKKLQNFACQLSPNRCFSPQKDKALCTQNINESPWMEQANPNHKLQSLIQIMSNISKEN